MTLTPRQRDVLSKLVALYRERRQPLHYSAVGEALGINRYSAYDMLKVLERKGFLRSQYQRDADREGPGRSTIVFVPTRKARAEARGGESELRFDGEWEAVKTRVLERLRAGDWDEGMISHVLDRARAVDVDSSLIYCTEVIGALLAQVQGVRTTMDLSGRMARLRALIPAGELGLGTLAGLSLGMLLNPRLETTSLDRWQQLVRRYQLALEDLGDEHIAALSDFLQEALAAVEQRTTRATS